jgi:Major tropism determinant N-terminal domain
MINRRIAKIKVRRGTDAQRKQVIFEDGELVLCSDIERLYVGDGETYGGNLLSNRCYLISNVDVNDVPSFIKGGDLVYDDATQSFYIARVGLNDVVSLFILFSVGGGGASSVIRGSDLDAATFVFDGQHWKLANHSVHNIHLNSDTVHSDGGLGVDDTGLYIKYDTKSFAYDVVSDKFTINYDPKTLTTAAGQLSVLDVPSDWVSNNFVHVSGDTVKGTLNIQNTLSTAGNTILVGALTASNTVNIGGTTTFNNNLIKNFITKITPVSLTLGSNKYNISAGDCGAVLVVTGQTASYVTIPRGLPLGFNILIISESDNNITISPFEDSGGVTIKNIYGYRTISQRSGMCNILITGTDIATIAGDLS